MALSAVRDGRIGDERPHSETFRWKCDDDDCEATGFGFTSRCRARLALREYRDRYENVYR
jgi:hypothetical protein